MRILIYSKRQIIAELISDYVERYMKNSGEEHIIIQPVKSIACFDINQKKESDFLVIMDSLEREFILTEEMRKKIKILVLGDEEHIDVSNEHYSNVIFVNSLTQLLDYLNEIFQRKDEKKVLDNLTEREKEILKLIAKGLLNKEIANELNITERTVKNHISNIFKKLNVYDRTQAAVVAIKNTF